MDMEELKRDYCAGVLSIQKVANKHGVHKSTLSDWAKKYGWKRAEKPSKKSVQNENGRREGKWTDGKTAQTPRQY
jgi:uncharacterized protein YjcR